MSEQGERIGAWVESLQPFEEGTFGEEVLSRVGEWPLPRWAADYSAQQIRDERLADEAFASAFIPRYVATRLRSNAERAKTERESGHAQEASRLMRIAVFWQGVSDWAARLA